MKNRWLLAAVVSLYLLCGCYDGKEIDEREFVIAMGIDSGANGEFSVSAGIAGGTGSEDGGVVGEVRAHSGKTFPAAAGLFTSRESRSMYYGHMKTLVISEETLNSRAMTEEIVDVLMRGSVFGEKIVMFSSGNAEDVLRAVKEQESGDGLNIWDFYKNNSVEVLNANPLVLKDFLEKFLAGNDVVVPLITAGEDITAGGGVVCSPEGVNGRLTAEEMRGYIYVCGNGAGTLEELERGGAVEIVSNKAEFLFEDSGGLKCTVNIKIRANIAGLPKGTELAAQKALEEKVKASVLSAFQRSRDMESDIFCISQSLAAKNPTLYEKYEASATEAAFDVNVSAKIASSGVIY